MAVLSISESRAKLGADPAAAVVTPAVTARLVNGHARLSAGPFNWDADLPAILGGGNLAPSPTNYLLGALAGCAVTFLTDTLAPEFGVRIDDVTAVARCTSDLRGLVGIEGAPSALSGLELEIEIVSPDGPERTDPLLAAWRERCPIYLALLDANHIGLTSRVAAVA